MTYGVLVDSGLGYPNGILFDEAGNRLFVLNGGLAGRPILAVDLADTSLSVVVETGFNAIDGLSVDDDGFTYFSSWATDRVYRYDPEFSNPPEIVSEGHNNPADIFVNTIDDILAVPNFNGNSVDMISLAPQSAPGCGTVLPEVSLTAHPSPFIDAITIEITAPPGMTAGNLSIFSIEGRLVRTFPESGELSQLTWTGSDDSGKAVPSGIYVVVFKAFGVSSSRTIVRLD